MSNNIMHNFHKANYTLINEINSCIDWVHKISDPDVASQVSTLNSFLSSFINPFVPVKKSECQRNTGLPWFNADLRKLKKITRKSSLEASKLSNCEQFGSLQASKGRLTKSLRKARTTYETNVTSRSIHNSKVNSQVNNTLLSYVK